MRTSQLMLYREIIVVYSEIHTEHINTLCEQDVEFCNVKPAGTQSDHWALKAANVFQLTTYFTFGSFSY
jgi:hypothetical protein